jgi:hypothetical protein
MSHNHARVIDPNDGIAFPMTDLSLFIRDGWTMLNPDASWNRTPLLIKPFATATLLLTLPEIALILS